MSTTVRHAPLVSPEEYLAEEELADQKHEYLNGVVYAMAGGTMRHSALAVNIVSLLHGQLRGKRCRPYNSDLLVRVQLGDDLRFYYPDVTIFCGPIQETARVIEGPSVIFEVLSDSTERTDTGEKRMAYLTIPALEAYVLVDSAERAVTVWRKRDGAWSPEVFTQPEATIAFASADCALTVGEIYEGTGL